MPTGIGVALVGGLIAAASQQSAAKKQASAIAAQTAAAQDAANRQAEANALAAQSAQQQAIQAEAIKNQQDLAAAQNKDPEVQLTGTTSPAARRRVQAQFGEAGSTGSIRV